MNYKATTVKLKIFADKNIFFFFYLGDDGKRQEI
jgi:hypothetical protein